MEKETMTEQEMIRAAVEASAKPFVETLKEACAIPSISAESSQRGGLDEMAEWLAARLKCVGAEVSFLEVPGAPPTVLGELPGTNGRTLMIYDHYDVQPVDPVDLWETPPFEPDERDGRVYARGASDNKGDLVARLSALETYRSLFGDPPYTVKFVVEGEEESGSLHFEEICHAHAGRLQADDCVWEGGWFDHTGRPTIYYGCKGLLYVELRCRLLSGDQHSSQAVYAPSAAWELVRALGSLKDAGGRVTIEGFYDDVAEPGERELAAAYAVPFAEEAERERLGTQELLGGMRGRELLHHLHYAPTANIAGISTGYQVPGGSKTVLPAEAMAKMDFRLVPDQDAQDIVAKLRRHLDRHGFESVAIQVLSAENPSRSPLDSTLGRAVERTAASWFPQPSTVHPLMWATGPMFPIAQGLGIPICSPPGVGRPDSRVHAPNENARISDYLDIVGFTTSYLREYGRT
jgi:acetylornithine deacetylase/succinyl-diaminopimelate desuccinylase-like protein